MIKKQEFIYAEDLVLRYPFVYKPAQHFDGQQKFGAGFLAPKNSPVKDYVTAKIVEEADEKLYNAKSNYPPAVWCDDLKFLVEIFQRLDAMNVPRDTLLRDMTCDAEFEVFEYSMKGKSGKCLAMKRLWLKSKDVSIAYSKLEDRMRKI